MNTVQMIRNLRRARGAAVYGWAIAALLAITLVVRAWQ